MRRKANEYRQDGSEAKRHAAHDFALLSSYLHAQPEHRDYTFIEPARDILRGQRSDTRAILLISSARGRVARQRQESAR